MTTTAAADPVSTYFDTTLESGSARIAAWVFPPRNTSDLLPALWLFCIPGGTYRGLAYYDRQVPGQVPYAYSMARHLAFNGVGCVVIDNLGTGQSTCDLRSEAITAEVLATAYKQVVAQLRRRLLMGGLVAGLAPLPEESIWLAGMGHSMGAFILTHFQGRYPVFDAVALQGMPYQQKNFAGMLSSFGEELDMEMLVEQWMRSVENPELLQKNREMSRPLFYADDVPQELIKADEYDATIVPTGLFQDVYGAPLEAARQAAHIRVPVHLSWGEMEIPAPREEPAAYTASHSITLFILPLAHHCTNFASNRHVLWYELLSWFRSRALHTRPPLNRTLGTVGG